MVKIEKIIQRFVLGFLLFTSGFIAFIGFKTFYPSSKSANVFVSTDKSVYYPGDRVGVFVNSCHNRNEFKNISYQLENDKFGNNFDIFMSIGNFKSISLKGCYEIWDYSARIPDNLFDSGKVMPGRFKIWLRVDQNQNPFRDSEIFQTEWFTILPKDGNEE